MDGAYFQSFLQSIVDFWPTLVSWVVHFIAFAQGLSIVLWFFFLVGIIYCVERLKVIRHKEEQMYDVKVEPAYDEVDKPDIAMAKRWESVQRHIESPNQNDWRQAIMEADIILDDLLTKMEYRGDSIGEKLNRVEKGDFASLDDAFEAHNVRNRVAHDGSTYPLTQYDAKRVINLYKKVFEEFYYI